MNENERRWIGIGGLIFVVLAVVLVLVVPSMPDVHASSAKLASFYTTSKGSRFLIQGFLTMAAVVVGGFWFWYFRDLLAEVPGARRLATVGFAGALIFAVSGGIGAGLDFVIFDAAGHASVSTIQLLNYLQTDLDLGLTATGAVLFLLATALVIIRLRALPLWLGWMAAVFAVASFAVTPFALLCVGVWMIPANIILISRSRSGANRVPAQAA
jgi:hypothetical protein